MFILRQAATARPEGPAPTITGPGTSMQLMARAVSSASLVGGGIWRDGRRRGKVVLGSVCVLRDGGRLCFLEQGEVWGF